MKKKSSSDQDGNALFLILIAVALFAALSYAVTTSGRGSGTVSRETALINASKIIQYAGSINQAITRMRIAASCSETQISFENSSEAGYTNASAPSDDSCNVFEAAGGGVTWQDPPSGVNDGSTYVFVGGPVVHTNDGSNSTYATANADLVMYLFSMTQEACAQINKGLGIAGIPTDQSNIGAAAKFTGTYLEQENINGINAASQPSPCIAAPGTGLCGQLTGCFKEADAGERYIFYNVVLSR